jgi:putative transposase
MARTGTPWRDLSPFFGKWNSVRKRFRWWVKAGVWERIMAALAEDSDFESIIIDGTIVRAHQHAAGGKGGFNSRQSDDRVGVEHQNSHCR